MARQKIASGYMFVNESAEYTLLTSNTKKFLRFKDQAVNAVPNNVIDDFEVCHSPCVFKL